MASRKLSNGLRDQIVYNVAKVAHDRLLPIWEAKQKELFLPIYRKFVTDEQEALARKLGKEWVTFNNHISVKKIDSDAGMWPADTYRSRYELQVKAEVGKEYPVYGRIFRSWQLEDRDLQLAAAEVQQLQDAYYAYFNGVRDAWLPVKQALPAYKTVEAMLNDLPELAEFIPPSADAGKSFALVSLQTIEDARAKLRGLIPVNPPSATEQNGFAAAITTAVAEAA